MLRPRLLRYAVAQLDPATSEDMVAETLLAIYRKDLAYPRDPGEVRGLYALAFAILAGLIANEYRARRRRTALTEKLVSRLEFPATVPSHEERLTGQWEVVDLLRLIPQADRSVLLLFNAGFTTDEVADILGCSPAAAAKRRTRAKARLQSMLQGRQVARDA